MMINTDDANYRLKMNMNKEMQNLYKISQFAGESYEIWWIFNSEEYNNKYMQAKNTHRFFFTANSNAHFLTTIIRIHMLNDPSKDVFSIYKLNNIIKNGRSTTYSLTR